MNIVYQGIKNISALKTKIAESLDKNITEVFSVIMGGAAEIGASDVHIEPQEENAKIRLRVDGILQEVFLINKAIYRALLNRIKLISGIKLNIANRPQDGRFSLSLPDAEVEIRSSTLPAENGEAVVLRILNPKSLIEIETLGMRNDLLEIIKKQIKRPNGMIIVTGPTGSGKTTTLYALLKHIHKPEIKIITIEDPIEYRLEGISQTQVEKGYDFASGLKSIMRQDPDVILVGEVRDLATVETALQAALTGHLVLTTLHTNDAAGTIPRLINLGANPSNIGPAINLAIAQRLVRKVCPKCRAFRKPTAQELKEIKKTLNKVPRNIKIPRAKGCKDCNFTGYQGRIGVFEAFLVDDEAEKLILKNPTIAALQELAVKKGMVPIKQDGLMKVLEGETTLDEIERVFGE